MLSKGAATQERCVRVKIVAAMERGAGRCTGLGPFKVAGCWRCCGYAGTEANGVMGCQHWPSSEIRGEPFLRLALKNSLIQWGVVKLGKFVGCRAPRGLRRHAAAG